MGAFTFLLADQLTQSDTIGEGFGHRRDDQISYRDALGTLVPEIATLLKQETLDLSDAVSTLIGTWVFISISDTLALSDAITLRYGNFVTVHDQLFLLDNTGIAIDPGVRIFIQDNLNFNDNLASSNVVQTSIADTLSLVDSPSILKTYNFPTEGIGLTDAATTSLASIFLQIAVAASDSLALVDSGQFSGQTSNALGDFLIFSDTVGVVLNSSNLNYLRRYLNDV